MRSAFVWSLSKQRWQTNAPLSKYVQERNDFLIVFVVSLDGSSSPPPLFFLFQIPKSYFQIQDENKGDRRCAACREGCRAEESGLTDQCCVAVSSFQLGKEVATLFLPSSTPVTIEAKLSSSSTISAAFLAASEPAMPIAIPMSAFLRAGESLTPSPVTATTAPCNTQQDPNVGL